MGYQAVITTESHQEFPSQLQKLLDALKRNAKSFDILLVCNRKSAPLSCEDFPNHSMSSEFLSDRELEELLGALRSFGLFVSAVFSDAEFYESALRYDHRRCVVFNLDPSSIGPSGKLLVAAFAKAKQMVTTGSSPYATGLARNKFHWSLILSSLCIATPQIWCYSSASGWLGNRQPPHGMEVLLQPGAASASIGVDSHSKLIVDARICEKARHLAISFRQDAIVREFIPGFEVECPVITFGYARALSPIGIALNGEERLDGAYLQYDSVYSDAYSFYDLAELMPGNVDDIRHNAERISETIGLRGMSRIDFRITSGGQCYVIDIAAHPHIIQHSAFARAIEAIGMNHKLLPPLMVALALYDAGILQPSDQC